MATIDDALLEIVREIRNVRDLRRVPEEPPENNDQFPFAVVYPASGSFNKESAGWMIGLHNINIELHVARKDLPRDYTQLVTLYDRIPYQLESGLENSRFTAITTWRNITYTFGALNWGGVDTLGVVYTMTDVKLLDTVT